jgi:DNA mismatch repair ATPase MutL
MLYNALRDVEEIAYNTAENIKPEWKKVKAEVEVASDGKVVLKIDEVPAYLNMVDVLFMIRDLLKLILEMDNEEKVMAINGWWK